MALLVWGVLRSPRKAGVPFADFQWHLRPHHEAPDVYHLSGIAREVFSAIAATHDCPLLQAVPA
eukprot:3952482-Lingulodinium_polyedra.AAC.1